MAETRLTVEQQAVVDNRGGTLLVSAAAGSGKTKVLVDRVLGRIMEDGLDITRFLIITFTNAAAAELRVKLSNAISAELAKKPGSRHLSRQLTILQLAQISTVHAFCGSLVREYGYLLDVPPDYRMLEDTDREELLGKVLSDLLDECYEKAEPDFLLLANTLGAGRGDGELTKLILSLYEKVLTQPNPEKWLRSRTLTIDETVLGDSEWRRPLTEYARRELAGLMERHRQALRDMAGDAELEKSYVPAFETQLSALEAMEGKLTEPWDALGENFDWKLPGAMAKKYENQEFLDSLKEIRKDTRETLKKLHTLFSRPATALIGEQNAMAPALGALLGLVEELDRRFSREKRRKNLMDFGDQEHLAIRLLTHKETGAPTDVAREISGRYTEIMVDEYQDSNSVQETIFTAISAAGDRNRFLVGDVKQSIYGFREAEPGLFLTKYERFADAAAAGEGEPRRLVLSKNFRSRPEILEAVNHTFRTVMSATVGDITYGADQALYPGLEEYPALGDHPVELHVLDLQETEGDTDDNKYQREARFVAGRIVELLRDGVPVRDGDRVRPVRPEDIAVLFRGWDGVRQCGKALRKAGIPVATGKGEDLFETPEVRVLMNLLRVLSNPHQDVPLLAVLCSPLFRFSNARLAKIRASSSRRRFYDAMRECDEPWCREALKKIEALRRRAARVSADHLVFDLCAETGLLADFAAREGGQARRENLLQVCQIALQLGGGNFLFLYELIRGLERAAESGQYSARQENAGVVLTTMHGSKGLEYPVVILSDLSRKFNFRENSSLLLYDSELGVAARITDPNLGARWPGFCYQAIRARQTQKLLSEEMRILYVAMTRARDYLIMTYAREDAAEHLRSLLPGVGMPAKVWAAAGVGCLGDWVLLSALNRIEAGELFAHCNRPACDLVTEGTPWRICFRTLEDQRELHYQSPGAEAAAALTVPLPSEILERLRWQDLHHTASVTPSKLTATGLKGRKKDEEAAEDTRTAVAPPKLQRPEFIRQEKGLSPTERGSAVHLFLQYADYSRCTAISDIEEEKLRLEDAEFMTAQQLEAVEPEMIAKLFRSPLGQRMLGAKELIREFKFSILEDAARFYPTLTGEQVLLQGVVDAAILEEDGLTVIDFKTDRVSGGGLRARAEHYRPQLETYRLALERIFKKPIRETILYFLTAGEAVKL